MRVAGSPRAAGWTSSDNMSLIAHAVRAQLVEAKSEVEPTVRDLAAHVDLTLGDHSAQFAFWSSTTFQIASKREIVGVALTRA